TVTIVGVGTCTLTATLAADTNYSAITSASQNITINTKTLTVSGASAVSRAYNASTTISLTGGTLSGVVSGDVVTLSTPVGTLSSKDVGSRSVTANYTITGTNASRYTLTQPTIANATITTATITISGTQVSDKVYDTNTTATVSNVGTLSGLIGTETLSVTGLATFSNSTSGANIPVSVVFTITNGTNGGLATNYSSLANANVTANIAKAAASVSINSVSTTNYVYSGSFVVTTSKTALSTGIVTLTASTTDICSLTYNASTSDYSVNTLKAGTCILNANLTSDANYLSATSSKSIVISPVVPANITNLSANAYNSAIGLS
ncbi:MAG: YDG domain-containing protein, partial [Cyanobium sp. MAG06]|nr:YDG domain-containing protein [Cyanobium sp. MAG06]